MRRLLPLVFAGLVPLACSARPPANWAQGGSPVDIPRARWDRGGHVVEIMPEGQVVADGDHLFTLDRAGRVFQPDNEPIALLQADGRLLGKDDAMLGTIGLHNSSLPGRAQAWLTVGERGEVVFYDEEGDRHPAGGWVGCGPAVRTCTLVTHVIGLSEARSRGHVGVGVGVGTGVGSGVGVGFGVLMHP